MKVLFATTNESKVNRFKDKLAKYNIELLSLKDIDLNIDVEENGESAIENALIKARAYSKLCSYPIIAMDDNLYIEGIPEDKQPGMYVRRVNGKRLTDDEMIEYYSNLAHTYGENGKLNCHWVYGIALINKKKEATYSWSLSNFYLTDKVSNNRNPGYPLNSISINKKLNKYLVDITKEEKEKIKEDENDVIEFIVKEVSK